MPTYDEIKTAVYNWSIQRAQDNVSALLPTALIFGDSVACTVNGEDLAIINFTSTHVATMALIAAALLVLEEVDSVETDGNYFLVVGHSQDSLIITIVISHTVGDDTSATVIRTVAPNSYKTIWSDSNAPRPSGLYITLKMTPLIGIGGAFESMADSDGITTIERNVEFTLAIQSFRDGAMSLLVDLMFGLDNNLNTVALNAAGVAYCNVLNGIVNLTGLVDRQWEERGSLDLRFRSNLLTTSDTGFISTVAVNGSYA